MTNYIPITPLPENTIYTPEQLHTLDRSRIPKHIAFIPDGNRRWAKKRLLNTILGHRAGADILLNVVKAAKELGVKTVTCYTFSTENWGRSAEEVQAFLWLLESYLIEQRSAMVENGVRLTSIGDPNRLPKGLLNALQESKEATAHCRDIDLVMAINYGGRDELRRAIKTMCEDYANAKLKPEDITETAIAKYLDTAEWKDPDLLIRTSGEMRISNFLIWQTSYTEVYLCDVLWPDFTSEHLLTAILDFQKRQRRWGGA